MDFPAQGPAPADAEAPRKALLAALGLEDNSEVRFLGKGPSVAPDWIIEVTPAAFKRLAPDTGALARIKMDRGVVVTCAGAAFKVAPRVLAGAGDDESTFDFSSRFFAPALGIEEDPVTGSAHCVLAPYWSVTLGKAPGTVLTALQASPRGGVLRLRLNDDSSRVEILGQAVTVIRGRMAA